MSDTEIPNLTDAEFFKLSTTTSEAEWNSTCDEIKAARENQYPNDWYTRIVLSGEMARIESTWK